MSSAVDQLRRVRRRLRRRRPLAEPEFLRVTPEDRAYFSSPHDVSVPLPRGAQEDLRPDHPRLAELRSAYGQLALPVLSASRWNQEAVAGFLDLRHFRGDTLITWHYRELPRVTRLKYYAYMRYVYDRDRDGLLERLGEDGRFGCWTYAYSGYPLVSRDLLDSVTELTWLERELGLSALERFSVLDIGAGYGRLAHRMAQAYPGLEDYCCVDAIPESTFVCEYYLRHRGVSPPARVVALDRIAEELAPESFDLAVNIHSFSECTREAIGWWLELLRDLRVPRLLLVPNDAEALLSTEADGSRRDFAALLGRVGYRLVKRESVIEDPAVRELMSLEDRFCLFELDRA